LAKKQIILSVKAGKSGAAHVRDLRGVMERESAELGVLLTFNEPTKPMRSEAANAGFYKSPGWNESYPRLQIYTVAELLAGKRIEYPAQTGVTFKKASKSQAVAPSTGAMYGSGVAVANGGEAQEPAATGARIVPIQARKAAAGGR